jgi:hypothetical protein
MRHRKRVIGLHEDAVLERTRAEFVKVCGPARAFLRSVAIEKLPAVEWKGRMLRTIRCQGDFGNGPHDVNVPESLLWSLISLERFTCPYHR